MKEIIKKHSKYIIFVSILLIICNLLSTLHPYVMKQILDIDFSSDNIKEIIMKFIIIYTVIHIILVLFKNLRNIIINKAICKMLKDIRIKVFNKVLNFKMITFNKYNSSELYTRLTDDIDSLFDLFFGLLYMVINNILYIVFMIIMMFIANKELALIGTITIFIISLIAITSAKVLGNLDNKILKKRDEEKKNSKTICFTDIMKDICHIDSAKICYNAFPKKT